MEVVELGDRTPLACGVGGEEGRTLFVLSCLGGTEAIQARTCTSVVETVRLDPERQSAPPARRVAIWSELSPASSASTCSVSSP